ncbi:MAG: nitrate/nitrite transporter [Halobacteria archaeon]
MGKNDNSYKWKILAIGVLANGLVVAMLQLSVSSLAPIMHGDLGVTNPQAVFLYSMILGATVVAQIPGGWLGDKFSLKIVGGVGILLMAFATAVRGFTTNYEIQLASSLLVGAGNGLLYPILIKLPSLWFPKNQESLAQGANLVGFYLGGGIALSFSPAIVGSLGGWQTAYISYAVLATVIALGWFWLAKTPDTDVRSVDEPGEDNDDSTDSTVEKKERKSLFKMKDTYLLVGVAFLGFYGGQGLMGVLPSWNQHLAFHVPAYVSGLPLFIGAAGSLVMPAIASKIGLKKTLYLGAVVAVCSTIFYSLTTGFSELILDLAIIGVVNLGLAPLIYTLPGSIPDVGRDRIGAMAGIMRSLGMVGGAAGPFIASVTLKETGLLASTAVLALPAVGIIPLLYLMRLKTSDNAAEA